MGHQVRAEQVITQGKHGQNQYSVFDFCKHTDQSVFATKEWNLSFETVLRVSASLFIVTLRLGEFLSGMCDGADRAARLTDR